MCYSAMVRQRIRELEREYLATVAWDAFEHVYGLRLKDDSIKISRALDANFVSPASPQEERIADLIERYHKLTRSRLEEELFRQKSRNSDARRSLEKKETQAARESLRISANKIDAATEKLSRLAREASFEKDSRIFPHMWAAIVFTENGVRKIAPARYHLRPPGVPPAFDRRLSGLYNARFDSLADGFWAQHNLFRQNHALIEVTDFFENVSRPAGAEADQGEATRNVVLHFAPQDRSIMRVPCLFARWPDANGWLLSFAAITDEPPAEVAAAGHDRCIIRLRRENVDAWLDPQAQSREKLLEILRDTSPMYFEHRIAA